MERHTLEELQSTELSILLTLDEYCRTHNIMYSLIAGSLLGAVRHGGFIPWDDDIDIAMTRSEYTKFCECMDTDPIQGYGFSNFENDKYTTASHGKFYKKSTLFLQEGDIEEVGHHEIWVDIFPLDKIPQNCNSCKTIKIGRELVLLTRANGYRLNDTILKKTVRTILKLYPNRQRHMIKDVKELRELDTRIKTEYEWVSMSTLDSIKKMRFPRDLVENYSTIEFEGHVFMVFSGYEEILKIMYGDYMRLPAESDRICKHSPQKIIL